MRRLLTPTCGAAKPTPCAAYMTRNISFANLAMEPSANSFDVTGAFMARNAGCGYFSTRRLVPSTTPGSISSCADMDSNNQVGVYFPPRRTRLKKATVGRERAMRSFLKRRMAFCKANARIADMDSKAMNKKIMKEVLVRRSVG